MVNVDEMLRAAAANAVASSSDSMVTPDGCWIFGNHVYENANPTPMGVAWGKVATVYANCRGEVTFATFDTKQWFGVGRRVDSPD